MKDRLVVLITNIWLSRRGGSETVVRDLALGLLRRGHRPIVYSPALGTPAEELAARGVCVIDDLRNFAEAPDIIHAHHCIPCGEALIRFPQTPAVYVCHAFTPWMEAPAFFPQIAAYVAVDEACRDRLVHTEGIDPGRVVVLRNAVDLARIPPRPQPLKARPERALAFGKAAGVAELRIACETLGIEYQAIGAAAGRELARPEQELVAFDLVFASARAALEALCCGCAVIACDVRGLGGLVTSHNLDTLRARNFGVRSLTEAITVEACVREIGRYDPFDAALVARRARDEASLEDLLDGFEKLYGEALAGARRPNITSPAHEHAVARFLHGYLPRRPDDPRWPWMAEREHLQGEVQSLETRLAALSDRLIRTEGALADCANERDQLRRILSEASDESERLRRSLSEASEHLQNSRMLKVGRLLRRMARLPSRY